MSSSPSRAPLAPAVTTPAASDPQNDAREVSAFPYSEVAAPPGEAQTCARTDAAPGRGEAADLAAVAQAKESGRQQGEREARAKYETQLAEARANVAKALVDFARERAAYYPKIEAEAVRLALSIARKVLHREAQVDPLLLMGIARVALEKIEGAAAVVLAVNPLRAAEWRSYLAAHLEPAMVPEIKEDAGVALEQCELRMSMGTAALGIEVMLKEIEQGLTDLMAARPADQKPDQKPDQKEGKA
jgi:flagellar assembly protein FliH